MRHIGFVPIAGGAAAGSHHVGKLDGVQFGIAAVIGQSPGYVAASVVVALQSKRNVPEKRLELFTSTRSLANIRMYERVGYNSFDTKDVDDELTFVYMEKM